MTAFACDSRLLLAGIGPAGSGKTTAMRALEHVLRAGGQRLVPLATSAAAADVLGRELGVRAENLHKFLHEWTRGPFAARLRAGGAVPEQARMYRLRPGDLVLVDEAGMAGTFPLDQLVQFASAHGAVVRLLGDDRQLPAVEGGGALRLVASQPGTPVLTTLYRFRDPEEAAATLQLRAGDASAVGWYARAGRVRSGSREAMAQAAYSGWKNDMLAGKVTLMGAFDGTDVTELSAQARADRVRAGQVEASGVQLRDGNLAGAGDWIVTRLNDRRLGLFGGRDWVKNGDTFSVEKRHGDGSLAVRHLAHGGRVTLPGEYVASQVQLLYATTAHRAQGTTVDTAHPLITAGMTREALYVLATRARESTMLYVATHDLPFDEDARVDQVRHDPRQYAGREVLLNVLATEGAPLSATETIATAQDEAGSLSALVPRYLHAAHEAADSRYRAAAIQALGANDGHELAADPAWSAVVRRLYDAEGDGWEPARLLATVAAKRELGSAESVAEVIAWRIDGFLAGHPEPHQQDRIVPDSAKPGHDPMPAPVCQPYESAARARDRLAELTVTTLGARLAERARAETAWPALIAALRRAENAGFDPGDAITHVATARELLTARGISELLAWRINRHAAAHPAITATASGSRTAPLLPWVPGPRLVAADDDTARLAAYINDAAALITARVADLADAEVRSRPPWIVPLGQQPADPDRAREWLRHVAVIAAYRDQHKITTDDPKQVLGPYAEPGHAGHRAYWHAAESVLAARQAAGLETATAAGPDAQASAQLAADLYRALPDSEREAIANAMVAMPGTGWLGGPGRTDEHIAVHAAFAGVLTATLIRYGHLTVAAEPADDIPSKERPLEADFARRQIASKRGRTALQANERDQKLPLEPPAQHAGVSEGSAPRPWMTRSGITHLIS